MTNGRQPGAGGQPGAGNQKMMKMIQQRLGNLELTLNSLIVALEEEGIVDRDTIKDKAQDLIKEAQERQGELEKSMKGAAKDLKKE